MKDSSELFVSCQTQVGYGNAEVLSTSSAAASLIVLSSGPDRGLSLVLDSPKVLGRNEDVNFPLSSSMVSRKHCKLWSADGVHWIRDLESTNGTWLNGEKIVAERLTFGDVISVADTSMAYVPRLTLEPSFSRSVEAIGSDTQRCRGHTIAQFSQLLESILQTASGARDSVTLLLVASCSTHHDVDCPRSFDIAGEIAARLRDTLRQPDKILKVDDQTLVAVFHGQTGDGRNRAKRCREALAGIHHNGGDVTSQKISFALTGWLKDRTAETVGSVQRHDRKLEATIPRVN